MKSWCILVISIAFVAYLFSLGSLWGFIIGLIICVVPILGIFLIVWDANKREKEVINYLNKCDEKLKKGEMSKEENEDIHLYYLTEFNF